MPADLKAFLDRKVREYNTPAFIAADPVSIPHRFTQPADIEIAGFFAALFAWGNRTTILRKSGELMRLMDDAPHQFVTQHADTDLRRFLGFKHRTFNPTDVLYLIAFLRQHYAQHDSLETAFLPGGKFIGMEAALDHFYGYVFSLPDAPPRSRKHIAAPFKGATCKRLNMYLRWMVRRDRQGVDFGLWRAVRPSALVIPVDLHVARVARKLGLLGRPATDWKAAVELTDRLRSFDPDDPVRYDFALFSLGAEERF
ncbi:TIGR02757 family protein [Flaviaesturariibacter amylovorans]|uniref:TIGR02757 family protein n=1 Tax=Flaviaesturariibacter amylovorans TaxID=1084520 RepID=A0ABP8HPD2_9BACT